MEYQNLLNDESSKIQYLTANEVMERALKLKSAVSLHKEFWYEGEVCILFAESNLGKSVYAMQIAEDIAKQQKVMYLDYELSLRQFRSRYTNKETGEPYRFADNLYRPSLRLERVCDDKESEERLFDRIEDAVLNQGIKVFVIDNITWLCSSLESGKQATRIMKKLSELKEVYNISVLVIAHTRKRISSKELTMDDLAGSKKLANFCDSSFAIGRSLNDNKMLYLKQIKVREGEFVYTKDNVLLCHIEKRDAFLEFVEDGFCNEEELLKSFERGDKQSIKSQAYILHQEGLSNRRIARELSVSEGSIRNWLKDFEMMDCAVIYDA